MATPLVSRPIREELHRLRALDPERWDSVCRHIGQLEGWDCFALSEPHRTRECRAMVLKKLNSRRGKNVPRNFDGDWLLIVVDHFPESSIADVFQRRAAVAQARREIGEEEPRKERGVA